MSSRGYVRLYRSIFAHEFFRPPFSDREAFMWLICEAAWRPRQRRVGQFLVALSRGEVAASLRHLAGVWGWKVGAVRSFLVRLERQEMARSRAEMGVNIITVLNYEKYQLDIPTDGELQEPVLPPAACLRPGNSKPRRTDAAQCLVYVMASSDGCLKVGISRNLSRRLGALQTGNPNPIRVLAESVPLSVNEARAIESAALAALASHRAKGEWLVCEKNSVMTAVNAALAISGKPAMSERRAE
ncbi:GIY-YIG nuclease family protein [Rhodopseudomonas sp. BR0C11]|uniref:GIY-YIG nuclease family protein n=1 Tax=Rhodopseudomonas sp. BR0C11 TaxID=2269370 RepID=UPI0013DFA793|nr:GIY-YIG nuclease family protein [Rhodopseudomonas sp. BR0C11]NEV75519.1 GIY-YIG nuclease family protein [Rhodopseudomonas sp. BR0C11]